MRTEVIRFKGSGGDFLHAAGDWSFRNCWSAELPPQFLDSEVDSGYSERLFSPISYKELRRR
jgi:hypothetical protein